ncbi:MAG: hypothetical protein QOK42_1161 [Frankiaceae bacterium]|nr:hypothetical protein [Frankiaceae bacterium]MDX6274658.1 hypothetical protein [Frankiales bacterium]
MATAPTTSGPSTIGPSRRGAGYLMRSLVLPAVVGVLLIAVTAVLGHVAIGLLVTVGIALGVANGLMAESANAKITPTEDPSRAVIIGASMRRLGIITVIALVIAFVVQPWGWTVLIGLAFYQLLSLASALGVAARAARGA